MASRKKEPEKVSLALGAELIKGAIQIAPIIAVFGAIFGFLRYWDAVPITHTTATEIVRTEIKPISKKVDDGQVNINQKLEALTTAARQSALSSLERDISNLLDARGRNASSLASLEAQITGTRAKDPKLLERRAVLEGERSDIESQLRASRERLDRMRNQQ
jgi:predicted  nucleic acid-binding Zn-ribbon protein